MARAKCFKCGASGVADTFEQARQLLDHSIGLGRGIKCGDGYNQVIEINPVTPETKIKTSIPVKEETISISEKSTITVIDETKEVVETNQSKPLKRKQKSKIQKS